METLNRADYFGCDKAVSILPRLPQPDFPEHRHEFHELVLVRSGRALHYIDGRPFVAGKGSVFYLKVGQVHYFDQTENLCLTNVVFSPDQMQASSALSFLPKSADSGTLRVGSEVLGSCELLLSAIRAECGNQDACASSMVESLFAQLIVMLSRAERSILDNVPGDDRIAALIRHIDQNFAEELDLCELAERFGIPLRTMTRRMVDATGYTPNNYLNKVRMCSAMRMLCHSELPITDIAFACGFNDSNYFSSRFHREIGLTPRQYRVQVQANLGRSAIADDNLALNTR
jgi:AraC family L-rhamnose operon regulatory protein RhaS